MCICRQHGVQVFGVFAVDRPELHARQQASAALGKLVEDQSIDRRHGCHGGEVAGAGARFENDVIAGQIRYPCHGIGVAMRRRELLELVLFLGALGLGRQVAVELVQRLDIAPGVLRALGVRPDGQLGVGDPGVYCHLERVVGILRGVGALCLGAAIGSVGHAEQLAPIHRRRESALHQGIDQPLVSGRLGRLCHLCRSGIGF